MLKEARGLHKNDKGASVYELSLVILLFYMVVFGVIDAWGSLCEYLMAGHAGWAHLSLAFVVGFILGAMFAFSRLRSRLKFYKTFIEHRLSSIKWSEPAIRARQAF